MVSPHRFTVSVYSLGRKGDWREGRNGVERESEGQRKRKNRVTKEEREEKGGKSMFPNPNLHRVQSTVFIYYLSTSTQHLIDVYSTYTQCQVC